MRSLFVACTVAVLAAGVTAEATAQNRRDRDRGLVELEEPALRGGFYLQGGVGAGREQFKFSDEADFSEALTKPTLTLRLGGTPMPYLRLGGELFFWGNEEFDRTEYFSTALFVAEAYPFRRAGLRFSGGVGLAFAGQDFHDPIFTDADEVGLGWTVGLGYEVQLSSSLAIGPTVELRQGTFTRRGEPTLYDRVVTLGIEVTFQTGGR